MIGALTNYIRFFEKIELFVAKEEAQTQTAQLKAILNELDNGILIAFKLPDSKFLSKYINKKINLLFGSDMTDMTDSNEEQQRCLNSQVFASVKDKKDLKTNQASNLLSLSQIINRIENQDDKQ